VIGAGGLVAHISRVTLVCGGNQKISTSSPLILHWAPGVQVGFAVRQDGVYGVFVKSISCSMVTGGPPAVIVFPQAHMRPPGGGVVMIRYWSLI
jgi:hypothetical protein